MKKFSITSSLFAFCLVLTCCNSKSQKEDLSDFPDKWIKLTEIDGEKQMVETPWGMDKVELQINDGQAQSIAYTDGGGAEQFPIIEVKKNDLGYEFVTEADSKPILFVWYSRTKHTGQWIFPNFESLYVAENNQNNFRALSYPDRADPSEEDEEILGDDDSISIEMVYTGADIVEAILLIHFQQKHTNNIISFDPADIGIGLEPANEFFSSVTEDDMQAIPTIVPNKESIYMPYSVEYHKEFREIELLGEYDSVPVLDQVRRYDVRSESEQETLVLLSRLPIKAFGRTTDVLSKNTLEQLLINGRTSDWAMNFANKNMIKINSKNADTSIKVVNFEKGTGEYSFSYVAVHTSNEGNNSITFWEESSGYPSALTSYPLDKMLPAVKTKEFYDEDINKAVPIIYQINDNNEIFASPNTFMDKDFEGRPFKYYAYFTWNGNSFDKKMVKNE